MLFNKGRWNGQHCVAGCAIVLPEEDTAMADEELQALQRLSEALIGAINDDGRGANGMSMAAFIEQYVPRLITEVERLKATDVQQSEWIAQLMEEQTRYVSKNAALTTENARMRALIDETQEYIVLHAFDTTVGRKIDDFITERLKALTSDTSPNCH